MILCLQDLEPGNSSGGKIWLNIGETVSFPESGWYDLPGVLLEYWIPALESFAAGHTDFCKLGFLDGPYGVWLDRDGESVWVSCMERGREVLRQQIDFPLFMESVERRMRYYERVKYMGLDE